MPQLLLAAALLLATAAVASAGSSVPPDGVLAPGEYKIERGVFYRHIKSIDPATASLLSGEWVTGKQISRAERRARRRGLLPPAGAGDAAGFNSSLARQALAVDSVKLVVTPATDASDPMGAWYTVSWSGRTHHQRTDRVLFYPAESAPRKAIDIDPAKQHPQKWFFPFQMAPDTYKEGRGSLRVWLAQKNIGQAVIEPKPAAATIPHNIKLVYDIGKDGRPTVKVVWQTAQQVRDAALRWRAAGGKGADNAASAKPSRTYAHSSFVWGPADKEGFVAPGRIYNASFSGLKPDTVYFYSVGSPSAAQWSAEASFRTPPHPTDASAETRFILTADAGQYSPDFTYVPFGPSFATTINFKVEANTPGTNMYTSVQAYGMAAGAGPGNQPATKYVYDAITAQMAKKEYHAFICNGDISYAQGEMLLWDYYGAQVGPIVSRAPAIWSMGNHEATPWSVSDYKDSAYTGGAYTYGHGSLRPDSGGEVGRAYRKLLQPPQPSGKEYDWYSIDVGSVHFIQLNSEQKYTPGSAQYMWLEKDLDAANANRKNVPWIVVGMHRQFYVDTWDSGEQDNALAYVQALEQLLATYQVDTVWVGHVHSYQRSCLGGILKGQCQPLNDGVASGPVHVMAGNAGFQSPLALRPTPLPIFDVVSFEYGFTEVIATRTAMTFKAYSISGAVIDTFTLNKPATWVPSPEAARAAYDRVQPPQAAPSGTWKASGIYTKFWNNAYELCNYGIAKATECKPESRFWKLLNAPPGSLEKDPTGKPVIWDIEQVWVATYPVLEQWKDAYSWNKPTGIDEWWGMVKPGGRMYYGP
ncbi:hypothetical protein Rsub_02407 [Raphidocelis subcapitata]|uniref:Purple acid phosphatase n=1 Tax=Raphidocelis subcapitata TaxID=307507 RepID=A0A2V0NRP9_9CHLO|nr:hypothetical protein Rsub_02407 [Raphidocelis subcapitata]|eukprot:GBF90301.1 hypothetical protein Rsub_02407 [Raphidocelis subcapitata]